MTERLSVSVSTAIQRELDRAVAERVAPSLCLLVGRGDAVVLEACAGRLDYATDATETAPSTLYDLSSLTKPLVTVALIIRLIAKGAMRLDSRVVELVPEFGRGVVDDDRLRASVTVADLLSHRSGLPAHKRYFERLPASMIGTPDGGDRIVAWAAAEALEAPPGARAVYSDLGFMVLGEIVQRLCSESIDRAFSRQFADPLGLVATGFVRLDSHGELTDAGAFTKQSVAPCGWCPWRGFSVRGVVQDENAYAMGGVAGHAGLFSDVLAVHRLVGEYLRAWAGGEFAAGAGSRAQILDGTEPFGECSIDVGAWLGHAFSRKLVGRKIHFATSGRPPGVHGHLALD